MSIASHNRRPPMPPLRSRPLRAETAATAARSCSACLTGPPPPRLDQPASPPLTALRPDRRPSRDAPARAVGPLNDARPGWQPAADSLRTENAWPPIRGRNRDTLRSERQLGLPTTFPLERRLGPPNRIPAGTPGRGMRPETACGGLRRREAVTTPSPPRRAAAPTTPRCLRRRLQLQCRQAA